MNERVPDSSGLPLRAMVMVLLFLGVIFLLVGLQAMSSGGSGDDDDAPAAPMTTTTSSKPAVPKAEVRVYTAGGEEAAATRVGDRLREAGWNVTEAGAPIGVEVPATTVYFGSAEGEQAAADSVGGVLEAPVAPRIPEIAEQPPGIIVLVRG